MKLTYHVMYHDAERDGAVVRKKATDDLQTALEWQMGNPHPVDWYVTTWTILPDGSECAGLHAPEDI